MKVSGGCGITGGLRGKARWLGRRFPRGPVRAHRGDSLELGSWRTVYEEPRRGDGGPWSRIVGMGALEDGEQLVGRLGHEASDDAQFVRGQIEVVRHPHIFRYVRGSE